MGSIASLLSAVAVLIVASGVLYLVIKASKAIDTLVEHVKTNN